MPARFGQRQRITSFEIHACDISTASQQQLDHRQMAALRRHHQRCAMQFRGGRVQRGAACDQQASDVCVVALGRPSHCGKAHRRAGVLDVGATVQKPQHRVSLSGDHSRKQRSTSGALVLPLDIGTRIQQCVDSVKILILGCLGQKMGHGGAARRV